MHLNYTTRYVICLMKFIYSLYRSLAKQLENPEITPNEMKVVGKRYSELTRLVSLIDEKRAMEGTLIEMKVLAEEEAIKSVLVAFNSTYCVQTY